MRHFVYFSSTARTSGNFNTNELMQAGRMDIVIHSIIQALFLSKDFRKDAKIHLVFYGQPTPPRHIEMQVTDDLEISKKDIGSMIKKILYKYKEGKRNEVFPKCFIEKKSFLEVVEELKNDGKQIFILDKKGKDIRESKINDECVFILGDQEGLPQKELKRLKEMSEKVSIGPNTYFASQVVAIVNNELDRRGI